MNYNTIFQPTEALRRFTSAHTLNLSTYFLIVAVIALTLTQRIITATQWAISCLPELRIRATLYRIYTQRWIVRRAIAVASFFDYNPIGRHVVFIWRNRSRVATRFFDSLFCLEVSHNA